MFFEFERHLVLDTFISELTGVILAVRCFIPVHGASGRSAQKEPAGDGGGGGHRNLLPLVSLTSTDIGTEEVCGRKAHSISPHRLILCSGTRTNNG